MIEYAEKGSLQAHLQANAMEAWLRHRVVLDAAEALKYLAARGIVHRDVAARNVLLSSDLRGKLADFGMVRVRVCACVCVCVRARECVWGLGGGGDGGGVGGGDAGGGGCLWPQSRESEAETAYYTSKGGQVPVRWSSPEALEEHKFRCGS